MAEYAAPSSDSLTAVDQEIATAQAALGQALAQLALDIVTSALAPTAANVAAVTALKQRVATYEALLASLYKEKAALGTSSGSPTPSPTSPFGPPGTLSGGRGVNVPGWTPPPDVPIIGVVEGSSAAAAEGAWGTFLDETDGLVQLNDSLNAIAAGTLGAGTDITIVEVGGGIVAALSDLPFTIIAVGMLMIIYLVGKILTFVGRYFPNPDILGWHPLNFIRKGIELMGQQLVDVASTFLSPVVALLLTPIHLVKALFQRVGNAIARVDNKVAALFNDTIPKAQVEAILKAQVYTDLKTAGLDPAEIDRRITGISDTLSKVQQAQQLNTAKIDNVSALGAVGLGAVVGVLAKTLTNLKTHVDTCVVENCDQTSPNNIHNILKDILAGIVATSEIAYVAEAIRNPVSFADTQAPGFEYVDQSAVNLLNQILSL